MKTKQCLRQYLLKELENDEAELPDAAVHCSNCSKGEIPHSQMSDLLKRNKQTRTKKYQPLREINNSRIGNEIERQALQELKVSISLERKSFVQKISIHEICRKATCKEDLKSTNGVRSEFVERFYNVVVDITSNAPSPSKHGRTSRRK